jgi:hypothetical protein
MFDRKLKIEGATRHADEGSGSPLPPGPNYGPFGFFRLALLIFAAMVAILLIVRFL